MNLARQTRNCGLDILRLIACVMVMFAHLPSPPNGWMPWLAGVFVLAARGGWIGVDLFFVLSGFLVSGLLFKEHQRAARLDVGRFFIRRFFKIWPPLVVMVAVTDLVSFLEKGAFPRKASLGELFFMQNYVGGIWGHTWSLAVEEHFYLGIALLFPWLLNRYGNFEKLPFIFLFLGVVCFCERVYTILCVFPYSLSTHLYGTHLRIDSLFAGVVLSYAFHYLKLEDRIKRISTPRLLLLGILPLVPAFCFERDSHRWILPVGLTLFYVGSSCLVLAALRFSWKRSALVRGIAGLGASSYSIYLWHLPLFYWITRYLGDTKNPPPFLFTISMCLLAAISFGWGMSKLVEYPMLRIRDYLFPSFAREPAKTFPALSESSC